MVPRTLSRRVLAGLVAVLLVACGSRAEEPATNTSGGGLSGELVVSAAASLADAFGEVVAGFQSAHPQVQVVLNLGGSSGLREQILSGAPVDVFASADLSTMDAVADADRLVATPSVFARNRLQIAVPAGNPAGVTDLADLADPDLYVGLCAPDVPCGRYARDVLEGAGVDVPADTEEPDVRALLTKIAARELDAGITYATDVAASDEVVGIDLPPSSEAVASYPIAVVKDGPNPAAAAAFVEFVLSESGQSILRSWGFEQS